MLNDINNLKQINWDFHDEKTNDFTHCIHPYPAKYIPQIPRMIIKELSCEGDTVADIFCGSGTTLVESLLLGRNAIGIDANPLACLISKAKTSYLTDKEFDSLIKLADQSKQFAIDISNRIDLFNEVPFKSNAFRPDHHAISFWFEPFIVEELAEILNWCKQISTEPARIVALTIFSSIIVTVSKQDSDTRYVRRDKNLTPGTAFKRFSRALLNSITALQDFNSSVIHPKTSCQIYNNDILANPNVGKFDLMMCSPPYPNAYSYHLYHMTRMVWLGMDQPNFKRVEIGSHRKYSSKGRNGATVETFRNEMKTILSWLADHLKYGKYACLVVGNSTLRGEIVNNGELISKIAKEVGFDEEIRYSRQMQSNKKSFNPAIGKIKNEDIIIFRNNRR